MSKPLSNFFKTREEEVEYYKKIQKEEDKKELTDRVLDINKRDYKEGLGYSNYKQESSDWSW